MLSSKRKSTRQSVANVALDRGDVIASFEAKYHGSCPVTRPTGNDVCMTAVTHIQQMKIKPINVDVVITDKGVYVDNKKKKHLIKKVPLSQLSWASTDSRNKHLFSFISHEPKINKKECFTFSVKKSGKAFVKACNKALSEQVQTSTRAEAEALMIAATTPIMPVMTEEERDVSQELDSSDNDEGEGVFEDENPWVGERYIQMALGCFKAEYRGGVPVVGIEGFKVVQGAATKVKEIKNPIKEVTIVITQGQIILVERDTGDHLYETPVSLVSYSLLDPRDKKHFYYIVNDPRLGFAYCHVLKLLTGMQAIERCIAAAQRAASRDRMKMLESNDLLGRFKTKKKALHAHPPIGVHEIKYLGAVRVSQPTGNDIVSNALQNLKEKFCEVLKISLDDDWTIIGDKIVLVMTSEGIRVVELATGDIVHFTFIRNLSFSTHLHSGVNRANNPEHDVFAYIEVDEKLSRNVCHFFKCPPGIAREICKTATYAFKLSMEEMEKEGKDNPFQAINLSDADISDLFPPHLIINRKDLNAIKILGAGQFGTVWLALHRIRNGDNTTHKHRAVKLLRPGASELDQEDFIAEALTMSKLDHPNLISLIGVAVSSVPWLVVLEFMRYGDLKTVLVASKEKCVTLEYAEQLFFAFQIASGMAYLASKKFVHMDLAARNCLLHTENIVKVGDFGLTKQYDEGEDFYKLKPNITAKLPAKWMAPESLERLVFSEATDVWAYGITLWELMTYGAQPYSRYKNKEMRRMLRKGVRLEKPSNCPDDFFVEISKCWTASIEDRHTFHSLKTRIKTLLLEEKAKKQISELRDVGLMLNDGVEKELPTSRETAQKVYSSFSTSPRKSTGQPITKMVKKRVKNEEGEYIDVEVEVEMDDAELDDMIGTGTLSHLPDNYLAILARHMNGTRSKAGKKKGDGREGATDEGSYFEFGGDTEGMYFEVERITDGNGHYIDVGCRRNDEGMYIEIARSMDKDGNYIEVERTRGEEGDYIEIDRVMNDEGDYIEIGRRTGSEDNYLHIEELHKNDYMEIETGITGGQWFGGDIQRLNPLFQGTYITMDEMDEEDEEEEEEGEEEGYYLETVRD
eukprot:m.89997 g.89997  ORF g.89997 m.89997 type:complete len:1085 (-) comp8845_c0_seq1:479-3733(-)